MSETGKMVMANSINIHYEVQGSGAPLIMLHGGSANLQSWGEQIALFAAHFQVFALDSRGHGKTVNPDKTLSYRVMAEDVVAFAEALHLTRPLIFGYSDGGQIALEIGVQHPDFAGALVLGGTLYTFTPEYYAMLRAWGFTPDGVDMTLMDADWSAYLQSAHAQYTDAAQVQDFMTQIAALWFTPLRYTDDQLRAIASPTLIWLGDRDQGLPVEQAVALYRLISQAELAVVPNATHGSFFNDRALMSVVDFLIRHSPVK